MFLSDSPTGWYIWGPRFRHIYLTINRSEQWQKKQQAMGLAAGASPNLALMNCAITGGTRAVGNLRAGASYQPVCILCRFHLLYFLFHCRFQNSLLYSEIQNGLVITVSSFFKNQNSFFLSCACVHACICALHCLGQSFVIQLKLVTILLQSSCLSLQD